MLGGLAAFGLCLLFGLVFTVVFIVIGLVAPNAQAAQGMSMIAFILAFISSTYVPVHTMPGWMQPFARYQPITPMVNAVRSLIAGTGGDVGLALNLVRGPAGVLRSHRDSALPVGLNGSQQRRAPRGTEPGAHVPACSGLVARTAGPRPVAVPPATGGTRAGAGQVGRGKTTETPPVAPWSRCGLVLWSFQATSDLIAVPELCLALSGGTGGWRRTGGTSGWRRTGGPRAMPSWAHVCR